MTDKRSRKIDKYALLSVYDKTGIIDFARSLAKLGYQIISTGGTAKTLTANGINVIPIQDITGNPESFDGRMKTISFQVESGILYDRKNKSHRKQAQELGIKPIDIVVCNLYPFAHTIAKPGVTRADAIENIDVGGPTMVRSAAKNFLNVLVLTDPADYARLTDALQSRSVTDALRQELAAKAFAHLSYYDAQIAHYFSASDFPQELTLPGHKIIALRYGENPHQPGAVYIDPQSRSPLAHLQQLSGKGLSLINITDINAGVESVRLFKEPAAVVIKHNTPCGIALGKTYAEALSRALDADPESAFGGVVVLNGLMDLQAVKLIAAFKASGKGQMDIIAAPMIAPDAVALLYKIRKSTGLYAFGPIPLSETRNVKFIAGGFVLQQADLGIEASFKDWEVVTKARPTKKQRQQMEIGWKFISRIRSNTIIVIDKEIPMTRGIGSGQTSRVRSTKIALEQAGAHAKDAILISDSFFPFPDSVNLAVKAGIAAIAQQGGSINDKLSITAANAAGIPMILTHRRAFWH